MENLLDQILSETTLWLPRLLGVIVILVGFFILSIILKKAINSAELRLKLDSSLASLLRSTSRITIIIVASITALGTFGINITALVAGLGLTGFALGFALKDTISNLLSGVLIMLYRPFVTGDRIKIAGFEGKVVSIDLRYTQLDGSGDKILIPNSKLFTDPITVINHPAPD
ncbi:MAG: mechanosensitive ion channel [Thioalkalispiraceae bacterium]|jgi:small-conductance mechanosensitive channel